ncbi:MAG: type 4a pilus biogenesis protein PilO, partial [candidate division WOR-3 bacterium]
MDLKNPQTQRNIFVILLLVVLFILFLKIPYANNSKVIQELEQRRVSLEEEVRKAEEAKAKLPEVEARYNQLMRAWEIAKEMLPPEKEIPSLLRMITNAGIKAGVSFVYFKPTDPVSKGMYNEIPFQLKVICTYHELGKFLAAVGNLKRIVNFPTAKMTTEKEEKISVDMSAF